VVVRDVARTSLKRREPENIYI
jgi:hypothetical protein